MPSEPFFPAGHIEVVCGPMFSGKSEELIRRVTRALIAKQRVFVFKPKLDDRYHVAKVASHAGRTAEARAVESTLEVRAFLGLAPEPALFGYEAPLAPERALPDVVAFDEAQFFDAGLVPLALELVRSGVVRVETGARFALKDAAAAHAAVEARRVAGAVVLVP